MCTQRSSSSAVCGYSSLSIMFLSSVSRHQPVRLRIHPGGDEGGQVQPRAAVQDQLVVHDLVGGVGIHLAVGQRSRGIGCTSPARANWGPGGQELTGRCRCRGWFDAAASVVLLGVGDGLGTGWSQADPGYDAASTSRPPRQSGVVGLVLVGVGLGELDDGAVEGVARRPGRRRSRHDRRSGRARGPASTRTAGRRRSSPPAIMPSISADALPVLQLAHVEVAVDAVRAGWSSAASPGRCRWRPASGAGRPPPARRGWRSRSCRA